MAMIFCPECGASVSDQAVNCPKCGYPIKKSAVPGSVTAAPATTAPATTAPAESVRPAKNNDMSVAGLICAFLFPVLGLILSIIGRKQALRDGDRTDLATAGIWISAIYLALAGIGVLISIIAYAGMFALTL